MTTVVGTTVAYGFVNNQITFRNCPEYFTKGMLAHRLKTSIGYGPGISLAYCILPDFIYKRLPDDRLDEDTAKKLLNKDNVNFIAHWYGVNRTWKVGVTLALPIVLASRVGPWPKVHAQDLVKPLAIGVAGICYAELIAGTVGYYKAKNDAQYQTNALCECAANDLSGEVAPHYIANNWAHNALYTGGALASGTLAAYIFAKRLEYV